MCLLRQKIALEYVTIHLGKESEYCPNYKYLTIFVFTIQNNLLYIVRR